MEEKLTKELAKKIMATKGEARGITIKSDWEVILKEKGQAALKKLEAKMAELGYPLKYREIKTMDFYPIGLDAISTLAIKEVFGLTDKEAEEIGAKAVKFSLFLKIIMKYFFSPRLLVKEAPKMWRKHYTVGDLAVSKFNQKERYAVITLKNLAIHPSFCTALKGYFARIVQMTVGMPAACQETKCVFRGDSYHQFLIKW